MNNVEFYDAHAHQIQEQSGGFILGQEGLPFFEGTYSNDEVIKMCADKEMFFPISYVTKDLLPQTNPLLKYHPRREHYSVKEVSDHIAENNPKMCIIDTLNFPYWKPEDYRDIALKHQSVTFLFAHSGGMDISEFVKYFLFMKNVWLDFSLTHEYYHWISQDLVCPFNDIIEFALDHKSLKHKILFGSDIPFFSQMPAVEKYSKHKNSELFLKDNFLKLLEVINVQ